MGCGPPEEKKEGNKGCPNDPEKNKQQTKPEETEKKPEEKKEGNNTEFKKDIHEESKIKWKRDRF